MFYDGRFCFLNIGHIWSVGWLFGLNGRLRQYFSRYRVVSQREGERRKMIDERKKIQTTPIRTYCKRTGPCPAIIQSSRSPRHWKFTQHHRTTRPPGPPTLEPCSGSVVRFSDSFVSSILRFPYNFLFVLFCLLSMYLSECWFSLYLKTFLLVAHTYLIRYLSPDALAYQLTGITVIDVARRGCLRSQINT